MNYHLMVDEKFIDDFIKEADFISPKNNTYIFTFKNAKHVTSKSGIHALYGSKELEALKEQITSKDKVFVHQLTYNAAKFLNSLNEKIEINAFFWGGDFLSDPIHVHKKRVFGPKTLRLFNLHLQHPFVYSKTTREFIGNLKNRVLFHSKEQRHIFETKKKAVQKINYILHWNEFDQKIVNRIYEANTKFAFFYYEFGLNTPLNNSRKRTSDKVSVLLGNSDSATNNHLEAIDEVKRLNIKELEVYCPLNYGINPKLKQKVEAYGTKKLGNQFNSINEFMPRDLYYEMVSKVDFAIMNHFRTQAAGNVFFLINSGVPVFMNEKSSLYQLLISLSIKVYNIKDLSNYEEKCKEHPEVISMNRELLTSFLNTELKRKNLENILS